MIDDFYYRNNGHVVLQTLLVCNYPYAALADLRLHTADLKLLAHLFKQTACFMFETAV